MTRPLILLVAHPLDNFNSRDRSTRMLIKSGQSYDWDAHKIAIITG